jgi:hypothetical protein
VKKFLTVACLLALVSTGRLPAQPPLIEQPRAPLPEIRTDLSPGALAPTPEMWFYEQERRRANDPKQLIRAKAEFRAAQRQRRLAAQRWYGYSASRPPANHTPWMGTTYSPAWTGGQLDPFIWSGAGGPLIVGARPGQGLY